MRKRKKPTKRQIEKLLEYNPRTGVFRWLVDRPGKDGGPKAGDVAGYIIKSIGYRAIGINRNAYLAHRLAFLLMIGKWPKHQVDHLNMVRLDNRWRNLREATKAQNMRNRREQKNNKSGMRGVWFCERTNRFEAYIKVDRHRIGLGHHDLFEDAVAARLKAEARYFGEFRPIEQEKAA